MTLGIVTPDRDLAFAEVGSTPNRSAFCIVPVGARSGMRLLGGIDHRFELAGIDIRAYTSCMGGNEERIGEEIRAARAAADLTQAQLAEKLGVTKNTVARWERGEMEPTGLYLVIVRRWLAREAKRGS